MLNLKLRDEFLGTHTPGTMISLRDEGRGAAEIGPDYILSITYPTADVQTALRNVSKARATKPIVLMGDRGRGKSHIMAVIHHALESPKAVEKWAHEWGKATGTAALSDLELESAYVPISEPVHNQEYQLLWNLLFDRHPKGDYYRGKFEEQGHPYPPRSLLVKMFEEQPTALILDEFQKWFDGLSDQSGAEGIKYRIWAENFIQNLSEIAKDRPDILILVTSVLNSETEAFRQVHRVGPVLVDFSGPTAKKDRQRLVLHRLFENRSNIPEADIYDLVVAYASERFRLRFPNESDSEKPKRCHEVVECFPFSPELLDLLDNQILMAAAAQEARDLIRILAFVFRARGDSVPVVTPADFFVDDDAGGVQTLVDSIAEVGEQERLREVAQRNLESVITAVGPQVPHARELISALWMRSMSPGRNSGGTRQELHLDITRTSTVDGNAFQGELVVLVENSINIHGEHTPDGRLHFALEENPRAKVRATARNSKIWAEQATPVTAGQSVHPGQDIDHVRNTIRAMLVTDTQQDVSRVVVLGPKWQGDPWSEVDDGDKPSSWDRPVLLVFPEALPVSPTGHVSGLGEWLAKHVPSRRNTIRYLFPNSGSTALFADGDLIFVARCSFLCGIAWRDDVKYRMLKDEFDRELRGDLKKRFDCFLVLRHWDFQKPDQCTFDVEKVGDSGAKIPNAVEQKILRDLFDPQDFGRLLAESAWDLWLAYPASAPLTSRVLAEWCKPTPSPTGRAVLILDALSLRELPYVLGGAQKRGIELTDVRATGAEVPSETGTFAKALGVSQRSSLANGSAPSGFMLFGDAAYTDVLSCPFEDCVGTVPNEPNVVLWHSWLDDQIHLHKRTPDQIAAAVPDILQGDGFWKLVDKLRQGRKLLITSDHGYAVSKLFSAEERDEDTVAALRDTFGASRDVPDSKSWDHRFMPPVVMTHGGYHTVMGQCKWKVKGGFPQVCHGGLSLLEVAVPWIEFTAL